MKKLTTFLCTLALLFGAVGGVKAQDPGTKIYEKDWTAAEEIPAWYHKTGCDTGFPNLDGHTLNIKKNVEVTVSYGTQVQVANDITTIVGNDYTVRLRIKGTVDGTIACLLGTWGDGNADTKYGINVTTSFQNVDIAFTDAKASNSWVIIWAGSYEGTLSIESVEVYRNIPRFYVYDYTGKTSFPWYHDEAWGTKPTVGGDILTATNGSELGDPTNYMFFVADNISTEEGKDYIVRATVKGSEAGTIRCNFGTWGQSVTDDLALSTEYQNVDVHFTGLPTATNNHVIFQIGKYVGTVSLKKIEVFEGIRSITVSEAGYATFSTDKDINVDGIVTAYKAKYDGSKIVLTPVTDIPSNAGVVIKAEAGTYNIPVILESTSDFSDNELLVSDGSVISNGHHYALGKKDTKVGFVKVKSGVTIPEGKAYLYLETPPSAREFIGFGFDDEPTAIEQVESSKMNVKADNQYYNLAGQRVTNPTKGIYIVNGKKVIK